MPSSKKPHWKKLATPNELQVLALLDGMIGEESRGNKARMKQLNERRREIMNKVQARARYRARTGARGWKR